MSKVSFKAIVKQFQNGSFLLLPATPADRRVLDTFALSSKGNYVTVNASYSRANKTYNQCKTVFALISILFESNYNRKPNSDEREELYRELLEEYADKEPSLLHPNEEVPIPLSKMDIRQAADFINVLINLIVENCDLSDRQQVDVKQIFEEFQLNNNVGKNNPIDFDKNGNYLSVDEWCKKNNISMASGINDGTLEIAHIITKSAHPEYRNCVWNFLRLTHYEHIEIQHRKGWQEFLKLYPHLLPRVKNAYDMAHERYPFTMENQFEQVEVNKTLSKDENRINIPIEDGLF